ncbi:hypothetical protein J7J62_08965 [bacterium]|nr:hypothetical protein [bacterium]
MERVIKLKLEDAKDHQSEALPEFLKRYGKAFNFFTHINNHCTVDWSLRRSLYIYPYTGSSYPYDMVVDLNLDLRFNSKDEEDLFYDHNFDLAYDRYTFHAVHIKNKGRTLAYLNLDYQILLMSDITHYESNLTNAYLVLSKIVKLFNLKKLWTKKLNSIKEIKIGCDPEFVLINRYGEVVHASDYIDDDHYENEIGIDGSGDQLELRPDAGSPQQVVRNLKNLIKRVYDSDFELALTADFSLGGHIHIGVGKEIYPSNELLQVLDDFVGKHTRYMCERYGYGALSSWESKPWGFEYRTPSAAIFLNPNIAKIVLKLVKNIVIKAIKEKIIKYNASFPSIDDFMKVGGLTKKEAEQLINFYGNKHYLGYRLYDYWLIDKNKKYQRKTYPLNLSFSDEWDDTVKNLLNKWACHLRLNRLISITLFGLREDRGKVNTIKVPGYEVIQHESANDYRIGVAWEIRHGANVLKFFKALRLHIRKILKEEV